MIVQSDGKHVCSILGQKYVEREHGRPIRIRTLEEGESEGEEHELQTLSACIEELDLALAHRFAALKQGLPESTMMNKAEAAKLPPCSSTWANLSQAVSKTISGDTVVLEAGRHVLTDVVLLKKPMTLLGAGASTTQVDGGGKIGLFRGE